MTEPEVDFPEILAPLLEPNRYKILYGGRGGCKCLAVGTNVIMADGSRRSVEDVKVGESVMGPDSLPRRVLDTVRGVGSLYKVKQTSGENYTVNAGHILSVLKSAASRKDVRIQPNGKPRNPRGRYPTWPDVTNIAVELYAEQSKRWQSHFRGYKAGLLAFSAQPTLVDPYLLGVWLGDGTSREMRVTSMDTEIIDYCRSIAQAHGGDISINGKPGDKAKDIGFPIKVGRYNPVWDGFKAYGLPNNKHIPQTYLSNSEQCRLALLAGLIDTDGTRHVHGYYAISQVKESLARDIKYLADGLGFRTSIKCIATTCGQNGKKGKAWRVNISGDAWRIPCKIPHKQFNKADIKPNKDYLLSQLVIEPAGSGEWAGFLVDGDHLFLLSDGTVTHNSWGVAIALLLLGSKTKLRILCARELQKSIKDSVHRLLSDRIYSMGLQKFYTIQQSSIKGANGTEIYFEGLRHNSNQIKSYEGIDIVWVEEAATVSNSSWAYLVPTIRKANSEIWITFNPELEEDPTYQRFVINTPPNSFKLFLNWDKNPWFPEVLQSEKDQLQETDPDAYLNVWEGHCRVALDGAIYANELRDAQSAERICSVPHDPKALVSTFWDLGFSDATAIWFVQKCGFEWHVIDYEEDSHQSIQHYVQILKSKTYTYGKDYLPHDAQAHHLGTGKSIEEVMVGLGRDVEIAPRSRIEDGISAVRTVFPMCWFDRDKCSDGLQALRRYKYEVNIETGRVGKKPFHDHYSNGADALRTFAVVPHIMTEAYLNPTGKPLSMQAEFDPYREGNTQMVSDFDPYGGA